MVVDFITVTTIQTLDVGGILTLIALLAISPEPSDPVGCFKANRLESVQKSMSEILPKRKTHLIVGSPETPAPMIATLLVLGILHKVRNLEWKVKD